MTLSQLKKKARTCSRLCKFIFFTICLTWWFGVLTPLGHIQQGDLKWQTCAFWALAGLSAIGLQMLLCDHFDRLKHHYLKKLERWHKKHPPVYEPRYGYDPDLRTHEVRSA